MFLDVFRYNINLDVLGVFRQNSLNLDMIRCI